MKLYKFYSSFLLTATFCIASVTAFAQDSANTGFAPGGKGYKQLNFGIELGRSMPVYVGMDFGVGQFITVGPQLSLYTRSDVQSLMNMETRSRSTVAIPSIRGDYHFSGHIKGLPAELDLYGGLSLGLVIAHNRSEIRRDGELLDVQPDPSTATESRLWVQVGGRYFFSDNWGAQLEYSTRKHGGGISTVGLSYRF